MSGAVWLPTMVCILVTSSLRGTGINSTLMPTLFISSFTYFVQRLSVMVDPSGALLRSNSSTVIVTLSKFLSPYVV